MDRFIGKFLKPLKKLTAQQSCESIAVPYRLMLLHRHKIWASCTFFAREKFSILLSNTFEKKGLRVRATLTGAGRRISHSPFLCKFRTFNKFFLYFSLHEYFSWGNVVRHCIAWHLKLPLPLTLSCVLTCFTEIKRFSSILLTKTL